MRYYLDTEFNGHGGALLSLALVRDDLRYIYAIMPAPPRSQIVPWVASNVIPIMHDVPKQIAPVYPASQVHLAHALSAFFKGDENPVIVTDWPTDIKMFCEAIMVKPDEMVSIPRLTFEMHRVDAYPTRVADAVQHNAWWDAVALRQKLIEIAQEGAPA